MHDHDLDLIAEYASDSLSGAEAARAEGLVASCAECAHEFRLHTQVRTLLATAPMPQMSDLERTRLRRTVLDQVAPPRPAIRPWQQRFLAVAGGIAALAVAVVGFGVLGQSADDGSDTLAGEPTTTAQADALVPADDAAGSMGVMSDDATEEAFDMAEAESAARMSPLLVDARGQDVDLDSVLSELTVVVAETEALPSLDDLVAFGATCAPSLESTPLAAVLTTSDGQDVQVYLIGDPAEPTVEIRATADCTTVNP
ncbi:MAG: hypothetical protein R3246_08990 [Acidimicrobiia bacterium]|nr:hypothetical protein [Acidimicrobiia bacterium]